MPLPRVSPLFSTYRGLRYPTSPLGSFELFRQKHGDTYELFTGKQGWTLLSERIDFIDHVLRANHRNFGKSPIVTDVLASYIGKGLLTIEGSYWREQRRIIQPGFSREKLATLVKTIEEEVDSWVATLDVENPNDVYASTLPLALQIMSRVLFSGRVTPAELDTIAKGVEIGQTNFARELRQPLLKPWRKLTNSKAKSDAALKRASDILLNQINDHKAQGGKFDDLLQMLLDARYENGEAMNDIQLIDETLVLILAGHETTAISLACTCWLLSRNPIWIEAIREEWTTVVGKDSLSAKQLMNMPVLTAVIREGLRLYPPAYLISRKAIENDEFDQIHIRAGQVILLNVYGAHRSEANFKDAASFRPDRYLNKETTTNFAFGGGPRLCVGVHLAMMELQIAIGKLVMGRNLEAKGPASLQLSGAVTMRPTGGVYVGVTER